jgi:hypothetical protein
VPQEEGRRAGGGEAGAGDLDGLGGQARGRRAVLGLDGGALVSAAPLQLAAQNDAARAEASEREIEHVDRLLAEHVLVRVLCPKKSAP